MGGVLGRHDTLKRSSHGSKLDTEMVGAMQQRASHGTSVKSFNSIIMKFPKFDESLRKCKTIFEQFDEDSNGEIDKEELKHCFQKLEISFTEEITDLFEACDINEDMGMKFNEFIVFLCLVYLLNEPAVSEAKTKMGLGNLEATFETLVDAFVFLDKNKDGYVSKDEMIQAINETTTGERSSGRIAMKRFVFAAQEGIVGGDCAESSNIFHRNCRRSRGCIGPCLSVYKCITYAELDSYEVSFLKYIS